MATMTTTPRRRHAAAGGAGAGEWAVVSATADAACGAGRVETIGKHHLMRRTGLPARDLRALDPVLSCPSGVVGRDRAVVGLSPLSETA
jgi:magnesium transporter